MSNSAIHFTSPAYGVLTACGRDIKRVACWDDRDAITCRQCTKKLEKTLEEELPSCAGTWCGIEEPHDIGQGADCRGEGRPHSGKLDTPELVHRSDYYLVTKCTADASKGLRTSDDEGRITCPDCLMHTLDVAAAADMEQLQAEQATTVDEWSNPTGITRETRPVGGPSWFHDNGAVDHRREAQLFAGYLTGAAYDTAQQLDHVTSLIEQAELVRAQLVDRARNEGMSWAQIGQQLGVSKQAAQKKFSEKAATSTVDDAQLTLD